MDKTEMGQTSELDKFVDLHKNQLTSSGIPEVYWKTLHEKIQNQIFNAGATFQLLQIHYEEEKKPHEPSWTLQVTSNIDKSDTRHVYLIDHTWTFRVGHATNQLFQFDSLCNRLCKILGLNENLPKEQLVPQVFANIWKICRTYSIGSAQNIEDRLPVWYVMDEIGSAVMHGTPNCRIVPFFHIDAQITYSLLFPIENIDAGEFVFVDFAEGVTETIQRQAALLPWVPHSFNYLSFKPEMPGPDYYLSGHVEETLPTANNVITKKNKYKVYSEYDLVKQYLTLNTFELVDNEADADILWYTSHFRDFASLSKTPEKFVNQFPYEYVVTVKDLLALTCRKFLNSEDSSTLESLKWFPITYNLKTEIGNFVAYFQYRESQGLDNYWIIKPYNLARSLDIHITNNLNYIMRLPATGPKIVQKYITNPVLFFRPECDGHVKFDIRYVILLQNINPLKCYVYKQFFLRFANKPFALNDFHDFEKHFTVMNYNDNVTMRHMLCSEFRIQWKEQYPLHDWDEIEKTITEMLKNTFKCAARDDPPCGIAKSPQSRALYAADIMLEWTEDQEMQPKLLEINWIPDCKRACEYYPDFFNDIFNLLFLNEVSTNIIQL